MNPGDNPLHLLRALLRQCTYLPDPAARDYMHRHIVSRYRVYYPRPSRYPSSASLVHLERKLPPGRAERLVQTARDGVALLQRANSGYMSPLFKVLAMTYGRTGKRRYELLQPFLAPDIPTNQTVVASLSASLTTTTALQVPPKLAALIKSQAQQRRSDLVKPPIKQLEPRIPEKNIWRRPVAANRVRNLEKRWLKMVLERVMPPLPEEEWQSLRRLATGVSRWEGPVPRRTRVKGSGDEDEIPRPKVQSYNKLFDLGMFRSSNGPTEHPHNINARFMQRLWARVFTQCPRMSWNAMKNTCHFEWGLLGPASGTGIIELDDSQLAAFEGVDKHGRLLDPFQSVKASTSTTRLEH